MDTLGLPTRHPQAASGMTRRCGHYAIAITPSLVSGLVTPRGIHDFALADGYALIHWDI